MSLPDLVPGHCRAAPDTHLLMQGGEPQHLNLDVPLTRGEIQTVAPGVVAVRHNLGGSLSGGDGGAGNELIRSPHRSGVLCRMDGRAKRREEDQGLHGDGRPS